MRIFSSSSFFSYKQLAKALKMINKNNLRQACLLTVLLIAACSVAFAGEEADIVVYPGIELDSVITVASSVLAAALFVLTAVAYKRSGRPKLIYVSGAFLLYAVKGFILASDLFLSTQSAWTDPVANFLDFAILLCFFVGIMKK
jgi:hypothetical protein